MNEKKKNFYRKKLRDQYKEEFKFLIGFICQDCIALSIILGAWKDTKTWHPVTIVHYLS